MVGQVIDRLRELSPVGGGERRPKGAILIDTGVPHCVELSNIFIGSIVDFPEITSSIALRKLR